MNFGKSLQRAKKANVAQRKANYKQALEEHEVMMAKAPKQEAALKSIWETNDLDTFLSIADARLDGYRAERGVRVVVDGSAHVIVGDKVAPLSDKQRDWLALSAKLPIPTRPAWTFDMDAAAINVQERSAFNDWRRALSQVEEDTKITLTPYEKNLEVWRQLWRVVERSDVIFNVVDARNPLAFRSAALERWVLEHKTALGATKTLVLLLNKADLLSDAQRAAWARHLTALGVRFYFFAARPLDADAPMTAAPDDLGKEGQSSSEDEDDDSEDDAAPGPARPPGGASAAPMPAKKQRRSGQRREMRGVPTVVNPYELQQHQAARAAAIKAAAAKSTARPAPKTGGINPAAPKELQRAVAQQGVQQGSLPVANAPEVFTPERLLEVLAEEWAPAVLGGAGGSAERPLMIGLVGYPNVGKSSTINAILGAKKVVVSATPGKTKHFQTLPIPAEPRVMLCDCPGLVFPSCAASRETMVCDGILPIDNCRDFMAPIAVVCQRVPRVVLEAAYRVVLDSRLDIDDSRTPAEYLLAAIARRRGYMTDHSRPNRSRAARDLLKDFVDGRIVFVHPPPTLAELPDTEDWANVRGTLALLRQAQEVDTQTRKAAAAVATGGATAAPAAKVVQWGATTAVEAEGEDDEEGEWEDEEDAWDDLSSADEARNLSEDGGDGHAAGLHAAPPEKAPEVPRAEFFALELESGAVRAGAAVDPGIEAAFNFRPDIFETAVRTIRGELAKRKRRKQKHGRRPDEDFTVRYNEAGEKELVIDDDDEIVVFGGAEDGQVEGPRQKRLSKRQQRRMDKRVGGGVFAAPVAARTAAPPQSAGARVFGVPGM